ncbi:MAG: 16S rRNA (adenine(1518)-N(6)/adenine(1519)-N(6))-dimethyltransferase RsmA [Acidobacteriota bacterium]|nr:16S rRNA (adenine(1518)-N(6)/adenine(1519)-N(6))-dimethyltransferase RsmA [Acidobacteriota bacterium]MDQ5837943.1 16S rRNA (adenine(1518)-N(6)/adenine(1519)-N(6))-dimethyltransferase RsmA [Acidobacteriota bacterium]
MNLPRAKKRLGQNFLVDEAYARRIVAALAPRAGETVLEIGPGRGALTALLVESGARIVAVEFDRELVGPLRARFGGRSNFELVEGDALEVDFCSVVGPSERARVVANLPYNISTAILQRLIVQRLCVAEMVLMLQREVVARINAPPGSTERGYLTVFVEAYCEAEALFDVPPGAFRPVPKVWSGVVRLRVRERGPEVDDERLLWRVVSAGFAQRRKTMLNNLRAAAGELSARVEAAGGASALLEAAGVESSRRAETLTLDEWSRMTRALEGAPSS